MALKTDNLAMLMNFIPKYKSNLKRTISKCVTLLFVIYAFADISVLQAYCGNEAVGIPPAHHLLHDENEHNEDSEHHNDTEQGNHEHLSFCSSNIAFDSFIFEFLPVIFTEINTQHSITYENKHSNTGLHYLFRPPRIA